MSFEMVVVAAGTAILLLAASIVVFKRKPRRLKTDYFVSRWKELQGYLKDKATWPDALIKADKLLDEALKKRRFKGKSMGARMVAAQRMLTNNDAVWYAHNLCKKIKDDSNLKLREKEVKQALIGIRQALKDLGAFDDGKPRDT